MAAIGIAAACSNVMFAGFRTIERSAFAVTYSAIEPVLAPKTSSPGLNFVTLLPTAWTTPA